MSCTKQLFANLLSSLVSISSMPPDFDILTVRALLLSVATMNFKDLMFLAAITILVGSIHFEIEDIIIGRDIKGLPSKTWTGSLVTTLLVLFISALCIGVLFHTFALFMLVFYRSSELMTLGLLLFCIIAFGSLNYVGLLSNLAIAISFAEEGSSGIYSMENPMEIFRRRRKQGFYSCFALFTADLVFSLLHAAAIHYFWTEAMVMSLLLIVGGLSLVCRRTTAHNVLMKPF